MKKEIRPLTPAEQVLAFLKRHVVLLLLVLFIVIVGGAYLAGYRPGPGLTVERVGTVVVDGIPAGTSVYADLTSRGTSTGGSVSMTLLPGTHSVIVDAPDYQPWEKIVSVTSSKTSHISPVLVKKEPLKESVIGGTEPFFAAAATSTLPTQASPLIMGCQMVYVSDNRVIAEALPAASSTSPCTPPDYLCTEGACEPTVVYPPSDTLRSVVPFPGRTDAIVVSVGEWVYVLGLDPRTPQYFAPLARGTAPVVLPESTTTVDVVDGQSVFAFPFE
jgi:hypothetical protein